MINSEMTKKEAIEMLQKQIWDDEPKERSLEWAERWTEAWEKLGIVKFKNESVLEKLAKDPELSNRREAFRTALADAGMPEHTLYSSPVLEAFDKAFGLR